jgi:alpha-N-arabinofuranosidase
MAVRRWPSSGDMLNALSSASIILAFLRHADRVKLGCMTGGLHALAGTDRGHVGKSAAHYSLTQLMRYGRGVSLKPVVDCGTFDIPGYAMNNNMQLYEQKGVEFIDSAAAYDEEKGELNIFVVNRNWEEDTPLEIEIRAFEGCRFIEHVRLYSDDMEAANTYENPGLIVPSVDGDTVLQDGILSADLKKLSWNMFRFKIN